MGDYGYRESGSRHVGVVWWAQVDEDAVYVDAANEFWGLAFGVLADGRPSATLIGPSLEPRELHLVAGERGWGVELSAHVFVRQLDKRLLLGEMHDLPTDGRWFELAGVRLRFLMSTPWRVSSRRCSDRASSPRTRASRRRCADNWRRSPDAVCTATS